MPQEKIDAGTNVLVVTAKGEHVPAKVTKAHEDDLVDLEFTYEEKPVVITRSPRDNNGKRHDSWHVATKAKPADPAAAAAK